MLKKEDEKYIYNNVDCQSKDSRVDTGGSHVVHRLYRLKNDNMNLTDHYQFMKSTQGQINSSYDAIVAEIVNKWLHVPLIIMLLMPIKRTQLTELCGTKKTHQQEQRLSLSF